ncbi:MAG: SDR family NAD(P)-dependent oxidoreductase [Thermomicrobiales bacterium]|jgi:NAD(P)-dependent dehydrogenase (short-subunit alcohol dehydrogenase family)
MRLAGKVAIVTGGATGIGKATIEKFVAEGANVVSFVRNEAKGRAAVAGLGVGDQVMVHVADVTKQDQVRAGVAATVAQYGKLDILVNNAGINAYYDAVQMTEADWEHVFAVDLKGAWLCAKYAIPEMLKLGSGSIVNNASIHAFMTTYKMFPYAAAKSGLVGLTRSLALDYGPNQIRVNAVCPGWTRTALVQEWIDMQPDPAAAEASVLDQHPMRRIATPDEIANVIAFVASDEASFMTGTTILVDGGLSARFAS